jgi:upstream activation factor subunit UAF30
MQRFDVADETAKAITTPKASTNGTKRHTPPQSSDGTPAESSPAPKRDKKHRSVEETDAAYAARLQAEENGRARSTRGGGSKRKAPSGKKDKARKKAKSKKTVDSGDDSDTGVGEEKKVNRTGGFHVSTCGWRIGACLLKTDPGAETHDAVARAHRITWRNDGKKMPEWQCHVCADASQLSRPQTVKKIWEYIKSHNLQDPTDKRQIICDEKMHDIFKTERVHMFTMNKILNQNLYAQDE